MLCAYVLSVWRLTLFPVFVFIESRMHWIAPRIGFGCVGLHTHAEMDFMTGISHWIGYEGDVSRWIGELSHGSRMAGSGRTGHHVS